MKELILKNGLDEIHDPEIVESVIQNLKDKFDSFDEILVGSGEVFRVEYEMYKYYQAKIMARNIENQSPLIMSSGYWIFNGEI